MTISPANQVPGGYMPTVQPLSGATKPLVEDQGDNKTHLPLVKSMDTGNTTVRFRDAFEAYTPGVNWVETKGTGDIIMLDGNAASSSYLVISKDPLTADTVSILDSITALDMPVEVIVGLARSQATLGQEFSIEVVDTNATLTPDPDLTISSIQQATTTLTIVTSQPHGLVVGKRFQVYGCSDSRFNYPALVVNAIVSPTSFTVTTGPGGNIPSVTAGPFASGFVARRSAVGYSANGTSMVLENANATNASFYLRSEAGDVLPSGTIAGNHSATIGTTAPVALATGAYTYAWTPTNEYRCVIQQDRVQWTDVNVDSANALALRFNKTQVVPDPTNRYKIRVRATNNKSLTIPVAKIVSISKAGSTTWTVTTDVAHGLNNADLVAIYGNRDTANFPNVTTATAITVTGANTFTLTSTTGTATGYGGTVYRVNGNNLPSALGVSAQVVQSMSRTSNILTVTMSASFAGANIGDYVNLHGCRDGSTGADEGVDGAYRIQNIVNTVLTLEPIGNTPTGADITTQNCGGTIIKRTDLRLSYVRAFDYERLRTEPVPRPSGDAATAINTNIVGTVPVNIGAGSIAAGVNAIGDIGVQYRANNTGAATDHHIVSTASTNAAVVKASAGRLLGYDLSNTTAAWRYVKMHNSSTTPTAGAGVVQTIGIPPNGKASRTIEGGIGFSSGIGRTIVGGAADNDATATAANDVVGDLFFA